MGSPPAGTITERARRRRWLVAIVVLVNAGMLTHSTWAGSGDEPHYLAIAHSLAFDFDLDLGNNYGAAEPLIAGGGLRPDMHVQPGVGGVPRPVHDAGMPLVFTPYIRLVRPLVERLAPRVPPSIAARARLTPTIFYRNTIALGMLAIAGVLAWLTLEVCEWAGCGPRTAFWITLLGALSPPLSVFSMLFFTEIPVATMALGAFSILMRARSRGRWAAAGILTGLLLLVHSRSLGLCIGLGIAALIRARRERLWRPAAAFGASAAVVLAVRTAILHRLWGTWFTSAIAHPGEWGSLGVQVNGVMVRTAGLLVDQEFGLLIYAPIFLLAMPGVIALWRTRPDVMRAMILTGGGYVALVLLPLSNPYGWMGGWSPPARFLVPIVPFLVIAVAVAVERLPRAVLIPLFVLQIGIDAYMWQHPKLLWNDGDGIAAFCPRVGTSVCTYLPSLPPP